ncbi:MAG TPA: hypothetical protein VM204_02350, partial [Gaiellaceae bacterium]|nr:hypothetical protein [Gaiellaceae bacterium]
MRVLAFGTYERDYPRNAQVLAALRRAGVDVLERHEPVWDGRRHKFAAGAAACAATAGAVRRRTRRLPRPPRPRGPPCGREVEVAGVADEYDVERLRRSPRKQPRLALAQARLLARRPPEPFDVVLVGYPGHLDLAAARRAARGRPV